MVTSVCSGQSTLRFSKTTFSKDISFVRTDTTHGSQSTIVEYENFLVVIELPMINAGGNRSTNLEQDIPRAEEFLRYLQKTYRKPVHYILSSHWHLHSLSGITPFLHAGAKLISARSNWNYAVENGLMGKQDVNSIARQIFLVGKDTTLLSNTANPIQILFLDQTYTFKPTKDYLFFYLPKSKTLHASCMCAMTTVDFAARPAFTYNDRVSDLEKAITTRNIPVDHLIKLTAEFDPQLNQYRPPVFTQDYFNEFRKRGTPLHEVVKKYSAYPYQFLSNARDSVLRNLVENKIPAAVLNSAVYDCIKRKEFQKAVAWAQILNLYQSGEANFIDTLGEAHCFAGNTDMARHYSNLLKQLDPKNFPDALKNWEQNKRKSSE